MVGYTELSPKMEMAMVGKVALRYRAGMSNSDIAAEINQPIERVNEWVEQVKEADTIKAASN